jgi:hypothetical protein
MKRKQIFSVSVSAPLEGSRLAIGNDKNAAEECGTPMNYPLRFAYRSDKLNSLE